jgi:hypothetical protein
MVGARCSLGAWQLEPVGCWVSTREALAARVRENMANTYGWPMGILRLSRSPAWSG